MNRWCEETVWVEGVDGRCGQKVCGWEVWMRGSASASRIALPMRPASEAAASSAQVERNCEEHGAAGHGLSPGVCRCEG